MTTRTEPTVVECCSLMDAPITATHATELAAAFAALGDPVRLRLFSMIAAAGTACSCELVEPIGKSQPAVSHHTKVLAEAGLIVGEKAGRWVNWAVVPDQLEHLRAALTSSFRPEARLRGRVRVAEEASAPPPSVRLW